MQYLANALPLALTLFAGWCLWSLSTTALAMLSDLVPDVIRRRHRRATSATSAPAADRTAPSVRVRRAA